MFGEEHGEPEVVDEAREDREHVLGRAGIEGGGRLVEHEHPGRRREHRPDRDPLRLARRERAECAAAQRRDPEQVEHVLDASPHHVGRDAEVLHRVRELVLDGVGDEARGRVLADDADAIRELTRGCHRGDAVDRDPPEQRAAGEVGDEPVHRAQQRGLARTGLAHHEEEVTLVDREVDIGERGLRCVRVRERDVLERDHASSTGSGGVANAGSAAASTPTTGRRGSVGNSSGL